MIARTATTCNTLSFQISQREGHLLFSPNLINVEIQQLLIKEKILNGLKVMILERYNSHCRWISNSQEQ